METNSQQPNSQQPNTATEDLLREAISATSTTLDTMEAALVQADRDDPGIRDRLREPTALAVQLLREAAPTHLIAGLLTLANIVVAMRDGKHEPLPANFTPSDVVRRVLVAATDARSAKDNTDVTHEASEAVLALLKAQVEVERDALTKLSEKLSAGAHAEAAGIAAAAIERLKSH